MSECQIRAELARLMADLPPAGRAMLEALLHEWDNGPLWEPPVPPTGEER
jgi:hypothetical protein